MSSCQLTDSFIASQLFNRDRNLADFTTVGHLILEPPTFEA